MRDAVTQGTAYEMASDTPDKLNTHAIPHGAGADIAGNAATASCDAVSGSPCGLQRAGSGRSGGEEGTRALANKAAQWVPCTSPRQFSAPAYGCSGQQQRRGFRWSFLESSQDPQHARGVFPHEAAEDCEASDASPLDNVRPPADVHPQSMYVPHLRGRAAAYVSVSVSVSVSVHASRVLRAALTMSAPQDVVVRVYAGTRTHDINGVECMSTATLRCMYAEYV